MTDLWQRLVDKEKGTTLPALLARFIEAYECGPSRAEYLLTFKHLLGRKSVAANPVNSKTFEALASSDEASQQAIFERTLHAPAKFLDTYENLLKSWYVGNSSDLQDELTEEYVTSWEQDFELSDAERARRGDLLDNPLLRETLERDADIFNRNPAVKLALAKELGFNPDVDGFDLAIRRYQASRNDSESRHFSILKEPRVLTFWAKEMVGMLPSMTERSLELTSHPIARLGESIPDALRVLFEQGHLSYLFGLEIPCTLTCGALVEEAFQVRFHEMFGAWDKEYKEARKRGEQPHALAFWEKIDRVVALNPFASPAGQLANGVWAARTKAMHKPDEYVRQERYKSATILSDARKILQILFEPE